MPNSPKHNNSISYAKGCAIVGVILIHLIDWCEISWSKNILLLKELLYPFVLIFLATAGSVMVLASQKYDFWTGAKRFVKRGLEIVAVYFLYSGIKLAIYNFDKQPFFDQFRNQGTLTFLNILQLKAYDVPMTILLTISFFVMISPLFLFLARSTRYPKSFLAVLIIVLLFINYLLPHPDNAFVNFIYANGNVTFPIMLWAVPFFLGMLMAFYDDKLKYRLFFFWGVMTLLSFWAWKYSGRSEWQPSAAMYPLHPYYISFSFFFLCGLIVLFTQLEKIRSKIVRQALATLRVFGDNTLELYILHWVIIDISSWLLYPKLFYLWGIIPTFLVVFALGNRRKIFK